MRVYVELPEGWGPSQVVLTAWRRAGYPVEQVRSMATGERRMVFVAAAAAAGGATKTGPGSGGEAPR